MIGVVTSDIRIFADDTFIFRIVNSTSSTELAKDLEAISRWAVQWKMEFNPSISKQAVEVLFSNERNKSILDSLFFNNIPIKQVEYTKHLGLLLDSKLNYKAHIEEKLAKGRSGLGLMKQLKKWVSHEVLENIYKLYVRPNLDYADIILHKAEENVPVFYKINGNSYMKQIEQIQYEAARIITGAWKGTKREDLYDNLGWESLNERRVMRKLCIIYETLDTKFPNYLYKTLENQFYSPNDREWGKKLLKPIYCNKSVYKLSFFPATIRDWNILDKDIKDAKTKNIFKKRILNKIRPKKASYFGIRDHSHIKYLTMLRVGLSPLRAHKFKNGFSDTSNRLCIVCNTTEDTEHFLLLCRSFTPLRSTLLQKVSDILEFEVSNIPRRSLVNILLFGKEDIPINKNLSILNLVIEFIISTKRLDYFFWGGGGIT